MGGSSDSKQTSTSGPWPPAGEQLERILNKSKKLLNKESGFNAYPGQGYVDFAPETQTALGQMTSLASQPNPFYGGAADFTKGLIGGNYNLDQSGLRSILGNNPNAINTYGSGIASGQDKISVNPQLQALLGQNANALSSNVGGIASGAEGIGTEGDYRSLMRSVDPDFENTVQNTANDITDQLNRSFGGANFGSAGHTDYLTKQVGDVVGKMRSDNFNQNLANKAGILGSISGIQGSNIANRLGAAGALSGEQSGNRAQQSGILGQVGGFEGDNLNRILSAAGLLSGEQQQGFNNTRGVLGDLANLSQQDIQNRLAGLGVADSVYNSQYLPAERLAGVGAAKEAKDAERLQADMDRFAIEDMSDWDRLMSAFGIASGTGSQGNRVVQSVQQPSNPWSSILGGGILASQYL